MDTPTSTGAFAAMEAVLETEINNFVKQASSPNQAPQIQESSPTLAPQSESNAERITSSVARLTSNSIHELEGLKSELHKLQEFLSSEVGRVQLEIENALGGIAIIVDAIAPWKNMAPVTTPTNIARSVRARPPTNVEATQSRVGERGSLASPNRT